MPFSPRHKPVWIGLLLLLLCLTFLSQAIAQPNERPDLSPSVSAAGVQLVRSDSDGVTFVVDTPPLQRQTHYVAGERYERLTLDGYGHMGQAGWPDLPQISYWVALPPGAEPTLSVQATETVAVAGVRPLPAPQQELLAYDPSDPTSIPEFATHYTPVATPETAGGLYPTEPAVLAGVTWLRDYRLAQVLVHPLQSDLASNQLIVHQQLQVEVQFEYPDGRPAESRTRPESSTFTSLLAPHILNYAAGQTWRTWRTLDAAGGASPCLDNNAYRITLEETGMYKILRTDLTGIPSVSLSALKMCYEDQEIPIQVIDKNSNGLFDGVDEVLFYGQAFKTHDADVNVYWLTHGSGSHLRMTSLNGAPGSGVIPADYAQMLHLERDEAYHSRFPIQDPDDLYDHWLSKPIAYGYAGFDLNWSATFNLNNKSTGNAALLTAEVWGYLAPLNNLHPPHRFRILVNGSEVGVFTFNGSGTYDGPFQFTTSVSASLLQNGTNSVTVEPLENLAPEDPAHIMVVNWVELTPYRQFVAENGRLNFTQPTSGDWKYQTSGFTAPLVYDVTDPMTPRTITNVSSGAFQPPQGDTSFPASYAVVDDVGFYTTANSALQVVKDTSSSLRSAGNQADYVIITHPDLSSALTPLTALRQGQGLTVKTVLIQDIFDEFSYGRYDTQAIHDFLEYVYFTWHGGDPEQPSPPTSFVLLAGDSSYDHRNNLGLNGNQNRVPVYLRSGVDNYLGEAASDNQYVAFSDGEDLPYLLLGRLPAESSAELTVMIDKILTYEATPPGFGWQSRHLMVSDNSQQDTRQTGCADDPAGDFFGYVATFLEDHFPSGQDYNRLFYAECHEADPPQPYYAYDPLSMETRFKAEYDAGYAFISYFGHAGTLVWGDEQFVTTDLVNSLNNGERLPIMLPMACLEGQSHLPDFEGLSETMLTRADGGSVASFAPTGLQVHTGHDFLLEGFYDGIFEDDLTTLGAAVFSAKLNLKNSTIAYQDLHDTFALLGDPGLQLNIWRYQDRITLPIVVRQ